LSNYTDKTTATPALGDFASALEEVLHKGAQKMLQVAIEIEVQQYIEKHQEELDEHGHRIVVRNGYLPERELLTGIGPVKVKQPRIDDRKLRKKNEGTEGFSSSILPKYLRKIPSIDNLIPALYLKGISTNDFPQALSAILGKEADGLSATTVVRLKRQWEEQYREWAKRDLSDKEYVYFWVDGIYFNIRLDDERSCILVIIATDKHGNKELLAVSDGYRESTIGWKEMLLDLKRRGLDMGPRLAVGDGAMGFWNALKEVYPQTKEQRCWVHKTANILDKLPKSMQSKAKEHIKDMYMAPTREDALEAYDHFVNTYKDKYPNAVKCLVKDKDVLFTFYDFPAANWNHIRTTNPIESTFATVRLRTKKTKGCGTRMATLAMVFKLVLEAQKTWKRIKGYEFIPLVLENKKFVNGDLEEAA
jgi:transposase-like protein